MAFFIAVSAADVSYAAIGGEASVSFAQTDSSGYKIIYKGKNVIVARDTKIDGSSDGLVWDD